MLTIKDRKSSPAQDMTRRMNFAIGTLARAIANLDHANRVFADTEQSERLEASLYEARRAYQQLTSTEGKAERSRISKRANEIARQREAERRQLKIPF